MSKQEHVNGNLHEPEVIQVYFRANPYSVFMHWMQGAGPAASVLYVERENNGKMLVHPKGLVGEFVKDVERDPDGPQARAAGRYSIKQFGLKKTLERTLHDWQHAQGQGTLHAQYLGVRKVSEAGDRPCYTLRRTSLEPDQNGITQVTVYIDEETWFQVGTILRGPSNTLLGEYFYRDIQLNPTFKPDQFTAKALTAP